MLVLTRKYQEKIRIGDNITITVLRTKGKAVRLGIEAPADVPVIRGELSFENATVAATEATPATDAESTTPKRSGSRRSNAASTWATDSPHSASGRSLDSQRPEVQLNRVPRSQVPDFLPKLVTGAGPLRAMMEQR